MAIVSASTDGATRAEHRMKNLLILTSLTGVVAAMAAGALALQDDWAREPVRRRGRHPRVDPAGARRPRRAGAA